MKRFPVDTSSQFRINVLRSQKPKGHSIYPAPIPLPAALARHETKTPKEAHMSRKLIVLLILAAALVVTSPFANAQMQVYGLWHCYSDACSWASVPNMTTFDYDNHWIINRGGSPSVNLVVLSFVNPLKLMNLTTDSTNVKGIPIGMTTAVVNYFESKGVRVMMSIGGFSYTKYWDKALGSNPTQLGINAANAAKQFNVGMEIDYEKSSNPNLTGL